MDKFDCRDTAGKAHLCMQCGRQLLDQLLVGLQKHDSKVEATAG